jgi:hypothetical protein
MLAFMLTMRLESPLVRVEVRGLAARTMEGFDPSGDAGKGLLRHEIPHHGLVQQQAVQAHL